jgi:hypothetical protein
MATELHYQCEAANSSMRLPEEGNTVKVQLLLAKSLSAVILAALALAASVPAHADSWTLWTSELQTNPTEAGPTGLYTKAFGTIGLISVTYLGETVGLSGTPGTPGYGATTSYPGSASGTGVWDASGSTTFLGAAGPSTADNSIALVGNQPGYVEKIYFSQPVTNPLIAIWSLGANRVGDTIDASFVFSGMSNTDPRYAYNETVVLVSGGPSAEYPSGTSIEINGSSTVGTQGTTVTGEEGSGVIEVLGTFGPDNPIMFTTPVGENYYAFTVGENVLTPEPETLSLFGLGLLALPLLRSRLARRRRA